LLYEAFASLDLSQVMGFVSCQIDFCHRQIQTWKQGNQRFQMLPHVCPPFFSAEQIQHAQFQRLGAGLP
jgi:hypothetical protein